MDLNVGGGVAVGTLILIEEDLVGSFGNLMLRYFIAEGKSPIICSVIVPPCPFPSVKDS